MNTAPKYGIGWMILTRRGVIDSRGGREFRVTDIARLDGEWFYDAESSADGLTYPIAESDIIP